MHTENTQELTTTAIPVSPNLGMHISLTTCPSDPAPKGYCYYLFNKKLEKIVFQWMSQEFMKHPSLSESRIYPDCQQSKRGDISQ